MNKEHRRRLHKLESVAGAQDVYYKFCWHTESERCDCADEVQPGDDVIVIRFQKDGNITRTRRHAS